MNMAKEVGQEMSGLVVFTTASRASTAEAVKAAKEVAKVVVVSELRAVGNRRRTAYLRCSL